MVRINNKRRLLSMNKKGIMVALVLMSIGFAAVATTLTITGTINYGYDTKDFNVYFSEAILDGVVNNDLIEKTEKKSITFETKDLSTIGDRSILEYQVMNNSKQYDATVAIKCERVDGEGNVSDNQTSDYTEIIPSPESLTVKAQESRKGTVTVELKNVSTEEKEEKFKCSLTVNPGEREKEPSTYIADNYCDSVAKPNLGTNDELIPVTISDSGEITKVSEDNESWYDYCDKKWANAVILKDDVSTSYVENQKIEMNDIESMFVWIPKYKYRLWNVNVTEPLYNAHSIEIIFDTTNTEDVEGVSCATPGVSGDTGSCDNGEYMTHPAFTSFEVDGFWVGKFETGYNGTTSNYNVDDSNNLIIKPNVASWRNINVKNIFNVSKKYKENLQSHMMKNTEWGAVAYLSHSIFGINKEITINNNNQYKTGYAALPTTDQSDFPGVSGDGNGFNTTWNTENGFTASTTGNITGVYDMSGGAWEYVAAYVQGSSNDASTFTKDELGQLGEKFFDVYDKESTVKGYTKMILGDATGEMGPFDEYKDGDNNPRYHNRWYADYSHFADASYPWFRRGGCFSDGVIAGQFGFPRDTGAVDRGDGFRLILAPSNQTQ